MQAMNPTPLPRRKHANGVKYLRLDPEAIAILQEVVSPRKQGALVSELLRREYERRLDARRRAEGACAVWGGSDK
jgi:hypothetical protein